MNFLQWIRPTLQKSGRFLVRNAPHILMGIGTTASVSAVIFAVKAAPAAESARKHAKRIKNEESEDIYVVDLTIPETIKACWKFYIPAAGMEALALTCFWAAHGIDIRRQAVLSGLCATAEQALQEYQRKVQQLIGEKAEKEVRNAVAQDQIDKLPAPQTTVILSDDSDLWCIIDGQYFKSSYLKIKEAQNDANHEMIQHMYLSQSDLYWLLDPGKNYLKASDISGQVGWNVDEMLMLDVDTGMGPDHKPILSISYRTKDGYPYPPQPGFSRMM